MSNPFRNRKFNVLFGIVVFFAVTRLLGVGQIYHQDEYRWAVIANPIFNNFTSPHPPLTRYLLRFTGESIGFENLRYAILLFSFLNLALVYKIIKKITGRAGTALLGAGLFAISVYSAIAGLQIDIDGATLPFFGFLMYYAYLHIFEVKNRYWWWTIFGISIVGGFLTKVSFVLFLLALVADYLFFLYGSGRFSIRSVLKRVSIFGGALLGVGLVFYGIYAHSLSNVIQYAEHFKSLDFGSRLYPELIFKVIKSFIWLSPLLLLPTIAGLFIRGIFKRYRFLYVYLLFNLVFYLVFFDFTNLTIERYLMFFIIPTVIISSDILWGWISGFDIRKFFREIIVAVLCFAGASIIILGMHYVTLPLNPKSAYVNYVKHLNFNFLIPLTGGSGPVGFYFSASYILVVWLIATVCVVAVMTRKKAQPYLVIIFLVVGCGYNLLLLNEYLFGSFFGSVPAVARESVDYVQSNPDIKQVITYYDIGAYDLTVSGKYYSRFYTAPTRDYTEKLTDFRGHYMVVDFPSIDKQSSYWQLISRCPVVKQFNDKDIHSYIYDCRRLKK